LVHARDAVRLVRDRASGVEAIRARFVGHAYDLHRHQDFFCRGTRCRSTPGRVILIEPQEAHDGEAGNTDGFAYTMLYLPRAWLRTALERETDTAVGFRATLTDDVRLGAAIRTAFGVLDDVSGRLERDAALDTVVLCLAPLLEHRVQEETPRRDATVARRARDRLLDRLEDDVGADDLAIDAGAANRFQLARAFRAEFAWLRMPGRSRCG
jgi:hypothetical protein